MDIQPTQSIRDLARKSIERFPEHQDIIIDAYELLKDELEENPAAEELINERFQDFIEENIPEVSENPFHTDSLEHHLRKWIQTNYPFEGKTGKEWVESVHSKLIDVLNYKVYSPKTNFKDTTELALKFHHLSGDSTPPKQLFREAFKYTFEYSMVADTINKLDQSVIGSPGNIQLIKDATADFLSSNPDYAQAFSPYSAVTDTLPDTPVNALPAKIISTAVSNKLSNDEFIGHNQALVDLCLTIDTEYTKIFTPSNSSDFSRVHQKYLDNLSIRHNPLTEKQKEFEPMLVSYVSENPSKPASQPNVTHLIIEESARFYMEKSNFYSEGEAFNFITDHFNTTMHDLIASSELSSHPFDIDTKFQIAKEIMSESFFFDDDYTGEIVNDWIDRNMETTTPAKPKI